jgi:outer membrane protein OmpA-like peptidoglycan-associated protein
MTSCGNGGQPRDALAFVQATAIRIWFRRMPGVVLACGMSVGGCSDNSGPIAWWHDAVGGKIAEQRPPPPGSTDPYPSLASVPARPTAADSAEWNQRTAGLVTDRIKADQTAALAPMTAPATARGTPGTSQLPPTAPDQEPAASAALVGVTPPQPAVVPPGPTPGQTTAQRGTNSQAPVAAGPASGPAVAPSSYVGPNSAQRVANGRLPALPAGVPPRPGIAPPPPPPLVPPTVTPPLAAPQAGIAVDFAQNSTTLTDPALAEVKALARSRGDRGIAITGYGGATSSDPLVQSNGIKLGLSRARALANALVAQGVPYAMLRLNAEAAGRGASLRLLQ